MLLEKLAAPLAEAGLSRVNISLDTVDPEKFRRLTRFGNIERVWRGIEAAEQADLTPSKLNTVVIRGMNDDELLDLARQTLTHAWHGRFIELMPMGNEGDGGEGLPTSGEHYFSVQEMLTRLMSLGLTPASGPVGNGPARTYRIPGAPSTVGFISPLGEHFCATCNRLRLTADGRLRSCVLLNDEVPVRESLRHGENITALIQQAIEFKPSGHSLWAVGAHVAQNRVMCQIGG